MSLTIRQEQIIIGLILGDGGLEKNGCNVRLRLEHGLKQAEYLDWLFKEFSDVSGKSPRLVVDKYAKHKKLYYKWRFSTKTLPELNKYYNLFYPQGKKKVPDNIVDLLIEPLSLAIWYMDDGYKRNDCNAFRISTDNFSYEDQLKLLNCLRANFHIFGKLHKKANAWNIYIPNAETKKFVQLISEYIIPTMNYKINLTPYRLIPQG